MTADDAFQSEHRACGCGSEFDRTCEHCGELYCQVHDSTVGDDGHCPNHADPLAPLDYWRHERERNDRNIA